MTVRFRKPAWVLGLQALAVAVLIGAGLWLISPALLLVAVGIALALYFEWN